MTSKKPNKLLTWGFAYLLIWTVFGVHIFIHEMGHFVVFKRQQVGVKIFQVGLGPSIRLFRAEETDFRIGILPIGGFNMPFQKSSSTDPPPSVRLPEEMSEPERLLAYGAGIIANVLTGLACLFLAAQQRPNSTFWQGLCLETHAVYRCLLAWTIHIVTLSRYPRQRSQLEQDRMKLYAIRDIFALPLYAGARTGMYVICILVALNTLPFVPFDGGKFWPALLHIAGAPELSKAASDLTIVAGLFISLGILFGPIFVPKKGS